MFEEMVVSNAKNKKTNKPWTVIVSMAASSRLPCDSHPDPAHLYGSAAEGDDVLDFARAPSSASATSSSGSAAQIVQSSRWPI